MEPDAGNGVSGFRKADVAHIKTKQRSLAEADFMRIHPKYCFVRTAHESGKFAEGDSR
jgi:hypothetical protein